MIELLLTYKYFIIIPLSIIEGPILMVICGFFVTLGIFNPLLIYVIMVIGDIIGDGIIYCIGYSGKRFLHYFVSSEKLEQAKLYFKDNHKKALTMSKLIHGIGVAGLFAAGALHVPYKKYFKICALLSAIQFVVLLFIGIFFGHAYVLIGKYLDYYAAIGSVIILGIIVFILIKKYKIKTERSL